MSGGLKRDDVSEQRWRNGHEEKPNDNNGRDLSLVSRVGHFAHKCCSKMCRKLSSCNRFRTSPIVMERHILLQNAIQRWCDQCPCRDALVVPTIENKKKRSLSPSGNRALFSENMFSFFIPVVMQRPFPTKQKKKNLMESLRERCEEPDCMCSENCVVWTSIWAQTLINVVSSPPRSFLLCFVVTSLLKKILFAFSHKIPPYSSKTKNIMFYFLFWTCFPWSSESWKNLKFSSWKKSSSHVILFSCFFKSRVS